MGCLIMSEGWGWHGRAKSLARRRLGRKLDGCPRRHGSSQEVPSWCLPTLLPRFATPATAHGVKRLGNRIDDRVVTVRYSPCSITLREDEGQAVIGARAIGSVWRPKRADRCSDDGSGNVRIYRANSNVSEDELGFPKDRAVKYAMRLDDGHLTLPVHADNVDPVRVVGEKLLQCRHIMSVPSVLIFDQDRANCVHVRGTHRNGSCFCHHETPARMKATAGD
jgi:hypothetical protein